MIRALFLFLILNTVSYADCKPVELWMRADACVGKKDNAVCKAGEVRFSDVSLVYDKTPVKVKPLGGISMLKAMSMVSMLADESKINCPGEPKLIRYNAVTKAETVVIAAGFDGSWKPEGKVIRDFIEAPGECDMSSNIYRKWIGEGCDK